MGIPGPTSQADHPLQWWGASLAQPLPALPFDGRESLQQGLEVTGIADRSRFQQRLQAWVVNRKAFPASRQGAEPQAGGLAGVNLAAEFANLLITEEAPQDASSGIGGTPPPASAPPPDGS